MFKAVLWDFGGVITSSPFEAFNRFEENNDLPRDFIRSINASNPHTNAWARLESSKITVDEFDEEFAAEALAKGYQVSGKQVLELLSGEVRPEMVNALRIISKKYTTACLTNNVKSTGQGPGMANNKDKAAHISEIMDIFDLVVESSKVGTRKPDPAFYLMACESLKIEPSAAIFLDDLGINLKPAKDLGMTTIKVLSSSQALSELEDHLGLTLI